MSARRDSHDTPFPIPCQGTVMVCPLSHEVTTMAELARLYERMLLEALLPELCRVKLRLFV